MATAAPNLNLPLFYKAIEPLNSGQHGKMRVRQVEKSPFIAETHAMPVTVDEFGLAQRHYPIVFSIGENPIPIALMGLLQKRIAWQELVADAAVKGDRGLALQAMLVDEMAIVPERAEAMLDALLASSKELLPQFNQKAVV